MTFDQTTVDFFLKCLIKTVSLDTGKHFDFKEFEVTVQLLTQLDRSEVFPKLRNILDQSKIRQEWNQVLCENRSQMLANWLSLHITGNVLDMLCGDGMVGNQLAKLGFSVTLSERYFDYDFDRRSHHLSFFPHEELDEIKEAVTFDTVLISAMLHHEKDQIKIMELAKTFKPKRIIIIENPIEKQFSYNFHILWDLFFNQCLNYCNIGNPMGHKTINGWIEFCKNYGKILALERREDIPGIPFSYILLCVEVEP